MIQPPNATRILPLTPKTPNQKILEAMGSNPLATQQPRNLNDMAADMNMKRFGANPAAGPSPMGGEAQLWQPEADWNFANRSEPFQMPKFAEPLPGFSADEHGNIDFGINVTPAPYATPISPPDAHSGPQASPPFNPNAGNPFAQGLPRRKPGPME